jgi:hypothetical protein
MVGVKSDGSAHVYWKVVSKAPQGYDEAVEREVTAWFRQQPKESYAAGSQGLVKRWDKCLSVQGDYVEK